MMERREFMGAMAALFAGVVLPEPIREVIKLITPAQAVTATQAEIDAILKQIYMQPIIDGTFHDMQRFMNTVYADNLRQVEMPRKFLEHTHYYAIR